MAFEKYCLINAKLFEPNFNYLKFYAIIYFSMAYSKIAHKYFFKAFYRKASKNNTN